MAPNGRVAFANVHFDGEQPIADVPKAAYTDIVDIAAAARGNGLRGRAGGKAIQQATQQQAPAPREAIGFVAAAIILLIAFGSFFAMLLPLLVGGLRARRRRSSASACSRTLIADRRLRADAGHADRARRRHRLRAVHRHPAPQRPQGRAVASRSRASGALNTSGRAVLFAGATVCIALLGLLVLGCRFLNGVARRRGAHGAVHRRSPRVTLLPALLGLLRHAGAQPPERAPPPGRARARTTRAPTGAVAAGRPSSSGTQAAGRRSRSSSCWCSRCPSLSLRLGSSDAGQRPAVAPPRARPTTCSPTGFGPGFNGPLQLVARRPTARPTAQAAGSCRRRCAAHPGVAAASRRRALAQRPGRADRRSCPTTAPQDEATDRAGRPAARRRRPRGERGTALPVYVGGVTAIFDDFADVLTGKLPLFIAIIVGPRLPAAAARLPQHRDPARPPRR